jgi:hypothetical protein
VQIDQPQSVRGADRWRCITQENHGLSCGNNRSFELFSPDIVNESRTTVVLESDKIVNERGGIDVSVPGIKAPGFSWLSDIIEIIKVVATLVTIISIIIALINLGIYLYRCYKKKKVEEELALEDLEGSTKQALDSTRKNDAPKKSKSKI